ncbi:Gfo/Idh/MocA family protein [Jeotgalibacillus soli]|uniref:Oxidoreductase n=1 Tax=Jeotgalibacillus soli TaxID=889306 RepID=A0A0C2W125_9BACL|nr:Gfo/Idh/MocA family oxidoreductase [Jeotgalibacillus soli]KIL49853.1 oxidoreductase [Jeotgalibacillus soli]
MEPLKIGMIGLGNISTYHLQPYMAHPHVRVTAFCDLNQSRLEEKGLKFGVSELYTDYRELLEKSDVDAVSICTWNNSHAEIAIAALEAGKHVLVEKPLSMNVEEAEAIEEAVRRTGKLLQVGFVRRYGDNTAILKTFLDAGDLGEIYYAKASCIRRLGNPGGWFADKSRSGGGPLIDLGVHMIDVCWYLMGRPKPVSVTGSVYHRLGNRSNIKNLSFYQAADYDPTINEVEDLASAIIKFENGASLFVDVSFTLHAVKDEISVKIYGNKGGAEIEPELAIVSEKHNTIVNVSPQIDQLSFDFEKAFSNEVAAFVAACRGEGEILSPVEDGVTVMKMLEAVYQSAENGSEIRFDERG